jgi:hypothetical protein
MVGMTESDNSFVNHRVLIDCLVHPLYSGSAWPVSVTFFLVEAT